MTNVIEVTGLTKRFGRLIAVDDVSFVVRSGEIFGLLGENGAGKTTTIEILEGFQKPDQGSATVLGVNPVHAHRHWRDRIGLVLQESDFDPLHTVNETLALFASFFTNPRDVTETLELVGLADRADERIGRLSGGQKRRIDVALGIIGHPDLLFLDEPTTGFDPVARREFWGVIEGLREQGTSIVLTTHYMEEAERLCDRLAIMSKGQIVAEGTSSALISALGATTIRFELPYGVDQSTLCTICKVNFAVRDNVAAVLLGDDVQDVLMRLLTWSQSTGQTLVGLEVVRPTLNDVFLGATGAEP
ncbi:MAG: ABC transporter ATP-binding protein [Acidimicrobiaceae bacterium]|nr:ABC transporter ATP-binding protein [Acidimicrobiaceae bacterium]